MSLSKEINDKNRRSSDITESTNDTSDSNNFVLQRNDSVKEPRQTFLVQDFHSSDQVENLCLDPIPLSLNERKRIFDDSGWGDEKSSNTTPVNNPYGLDNLWQIFQNSDAIDFLEEVEKNTFTIQSEPQQILNNNVQQNFDKSLNSVHVNDSTEQLLSSKRARLANDTLTTHSDTDHLSYKTHNNRIENGFFGSNQESLDPTLFAQNTNVGGPIRNENIKPLSTNYIAGNLINQPEKDLHSNRQSEISDNDHIQLGDNDNDDIQLGEIDEDFDLFVLLLQSQQKLLEEKARNKNSVYVYLPRNLFCQPCTTSTDTDIISENFDKFQSWKELHFYCRVALQKQ